MAIGDGVYEHDRRTVNYVQPQGKMIPISAELLAVENIFGATGVFNLKVDAPVKIKHRSGPSYRQRQARGRAARKN